MRNRILAVFGIGAYILSVASSATDPAGNFVLPVAVILLSGLATLAFTVMAVIRLWNHARGISVALAASLLIVSIPPLVPLTTLANGGPIVLLINIFKIVYLVATLLAVVALFKKSAVPAARQQIAGGELMIQKFFKNTLPGAFGFAVVGVMGVLLVGLLYWLWMAVRMGSFLMFVVGVIPPAEVVTAPVGLYSIAFGPPHWVVSWFGHNKGETNWSDENKAAYVNQCVGKLVGQNVAADNSQKFCHCTVTALQIEFGDAEYEAMVKAQPNPNGNDVERRLYHVIQTCSKFLPQ